jgi:hypothetical protein
LGSKIGIITLPPACTECQKGFRSPLCESFTCMYVRKVLSDVRVKKAEALFTQSMNSCHAMFCNTVRHRLGLVLTLAAQCRVTRRDTNFDCSCT